MRTALGFAPDLAAKLYRWARGQDDAPVAPRPPPKTLSVQMSLTPEPLARHPSTVGQPAVASESSSERIHTMHPVTMLRPLSKSLFLPAAASEHTMSCCAHGNRNA